MYIVVTASQRSAIFRHTVYMSLAAYTICLIYIQNNFLDAIRSGLHSANHCTLSNKYVSTGTRNTGMKMYAGRVACCPWWVTFSMCRAPY